MESQSSTSLNSILLGLFHLIRGEWRMGKGRLLSIVGGSRLAGVAIVGVIVCGAISVMFGGIALWIGLAHLMGERWGWSALIVACTGLGAMAATMIWVRGRVRRLGRRTAELADQLRADFRKERRELARLIDETFPRRSA